jgi:transcriptional regulator with XRE-family HTH domain
MSWPHAVDADPSEEAISRAIGEELRRARETHGWSRLQLVTLLPSGIGDRTLLSYEHGTRHLTALRLIEICQALGVDAPTLLNQALQRARIHLTNLVLRIDLRFLLNDRSERFRPMHQWARNRLTRTPASQAQVRLPNQGRLLQLLRRTTEDERTRLQHVQPVRQPQRRA